MRKIAILSVLFLLVFSCKTTKNISNQGDSESRDGSSYERAVIIDKNNEMDGIAAEYEWIRNHYPGYQNLGQQLVYQKEKPFDIINIKTAQGETKSIYFDISKFFGKF